MTTTSDGGRSAGGSRLGFRRGRGILLLIVLGLVGIPLQAALVLALVPDDVPNDAGCALGLEGPFSLWCGPDPSELLEQVPATPTDAERICADFVALGDPDARTRFDADCGYSFSTEDGAKRLGLLWFATPASSAADLDTYARFLEAANRAEGVAARPLRPRPDLLVFDELQPSNGERGFQLACGTFDLRGMVRDPDADVVEVASTLADRWCPADS